MIDETHPAVEAGASVFGSDQLLIDRRNGDHVTVTLAVLNASLPHLRAEITEGLAAEKEALGNSAADNAEVKGIDPRLRKYWKYLAISNRLRSQTKDKTDD